MEPAPGRPSREDAVMLKACYPAEAVCIQEILMFCGSSHFGKEDVLN